MFRRFGSPDFTSSSNHPNGFKFGIRLLQPPLQNWFLENFKISPSITSPPHLKKTNIFCIFPYKFFASCNCWFGMHLPQGLLERYPLGFYIISILASPKKTQKPCFFRKINFPLICHFRCSDFVQPWHACCDIPQVYFSPFLEYLPPPTPSQFFFDKKIFTQNYLTLNDPTLFKLTMILLYNTWVFVKTTAQHLVYYFSL